jgi:hypothetical protein
VHAEQRVPRAQLPLDVERRDGIALQHLRHRLDQPGDRRQVLLARAEQVGTADDAAVGLQVDEQQRRNRHGGDAGLQGPLHRHRHRTRPDGLDFHFPVFTCP